MLVIGITGTIGAGKGSVADYLKSKGFDHYSVSEDYIIPEIKKRGLEINRESMYLVGWELKKNFGTDFIVMELYKRAKIKGKNAIIESIRSPGEIESLKKLDDFVLLAIDADLKTRYDRICLRKSAKDNVDFETFVANNDREMTNDDPTKNNILKCMDYADYVVFNNGNLDDLHNKIDEIISYKI